MKLQLEWREISEKPKTLAAKGKSSGIWAWNAFYSKWNHCYKRKNKGE